MLARPARCATDLRTCSGSASTVLRSVTPLPTIHRGALPTLERIAGRLEERLHKARTLVRLGGGFPEPALFSFLEEVGAHYVVGLAQIAVLARLAALALIAGRARSPASGHTEHLY